MEFMGVVLMVIYAIIGGSTTLSLVIGLPAVFIWKIYRKVTLHLSLYD